MRTVKPHTSPLLLATLLALLFGVGAPGHGIYEHSLIGMAVSYAENLPGTEPGYNDRSGPSVSLTCTCGCDATPGATGQEPRPTHSPTHSGAGREPTAESQQSTPAPSAQPYPYQDTGATYPPAMTPNAAP